MTDGQSDGGVNNIPHRFFKKKRLDKYNYSLTWIEHCSHAYFT